MPYDLVETIEGNAIVGKRTVHDSISDGTDNQIMLSGQSYIFTCNALGREEKSTDADLWIVDTISNGVLYSLLNVKIGFTLNSSNPERHCVFELIIPDGGGVGVDICVEKKTIFIDLQNTDEAHSISGFAYNGQLVIDNGLKIKMTPNANMTISQKSILIVEV